MWDFPSKASVLEACHVNALCRSSHASIPVWADLHWRHGRCSRSLSPHAKCNSGASASTSASPLECRFPCTSPECLTVPEPLAACGGVAGAESSEHLGPGAGGHAAFWQAPLRQVSMPAMPIIRNVPSFERPRVRPAILRCVLHLPCVYLCVYVCGCVIRTSIYSAASVCHDELFLCQWNSPGSCCGLVSHAHRTQALSGSSLSAAEVSKTKTNGIHLQTSCRRDRMPEKAGRHSKRAAFAERSIS